MTYAEAARCALEEEMARDERVWVLGEDIGPEGGVAGQYRGLQARFGPDRVFDTPISENAIVGAAVGAALTGSRPVAELRFADFGFCAADEIVNQAAKVRYMYGGQARAPLVVRMATGFKAGMAAQHSQSNEALWAHVPGLVVVAPATPADNKALLKAAIRCDDPVVYLEHKELWGIEAEVPDACDHVGRIGRASIVRQGTDLTVVTWSAPRYLCVEAATMLAAEGIELEIIDLRTIWPWDRACVSTSVAKTRRLLIVHEAVRDGGFGAEIAATMAEDAHAYLSVPPRRLAPARIPAPYSAPLEDALRLSVGAIRKAASDLVRSGGR